MRTQHMLHPLSAFPVYSAGFLTDTRFVLGGGGGTGRSGIRNKLRVYDVENQGEKLALVAEAELELGEDAPMTMAVHPKDNAIVCGANCSEQSIANGVNEHCRLYRFKDDNLALDTKKQILSTNDPESYQNVTAFSRDFNLIAVGMSNNEVIILSYPSLAIISDPFKIPSGILYGLDFSDSTLLVVTSKLLYLIPLPLNIIAVKSDSGAKHSLVLPRLEATTQIEVPSLDVLGASEDGGVRTFRAGRFNSSQSSIIYSVVNSTPAPGRSSRGKKVERKSFLVRWELASSKKNEKAGEEGEWVAGKVRNLGKKAVTVFTISENGKFVAYGASDSSVGILDTLTFAPQLEILKSHDFPPTLLQFNKMATLLVSGSADASVRVIVVPESFTTSPTLYILILLALLVLVAAILLRPS